MLGALMLLAFIAGRFLFVLISRMEGYSLAHELNRNDNPAVGIRYGLFLLAIMLSFSQVIYVSGEGWSESLRNVTIYGGVVVGMLLVSRYVNDYLILYGFDNNRELIGEKNIAVAIVEGTTYLATAFIMASALPFFTEHVGESFVWFLIGQILFVVLAFFYRRMIPGVFEELSTHNHACALSLGGLLLASGIALHHAISGPSVGWIKDFQSVGMYLGGWLAFLIVVYLVTNRVIFSSARIRQEVMEQRNIAAGVVEAVVFLSATLLYNFIVG
jgi:uncharacterized membrane protein YjfL (UPF0719 family)